MARNRTWLYMYGTRPTGFTASVSENSLWTSELYEVAVAKKTAATLFPEKSKCAYCGRWNPPQTNCDGCGAPSDE